MGIKDIDISNVTYYDLNNQINIPVNNKIPLEKDKEALQAFLKENVEPNTKRFSSLEERFKFLIENDYIEKEFVEKYKSTEEKIEALYNAIVSRTSDEAGKKFWVDEYKKVLAVYGSESTALRAIADRMVNENELKELADKMGVQW